MVKQLVGPLHPRERCLFSSSCSLATSGAAGSNARQTRLQSSLDYGRVSIQADDLAELCGPIDRGHVVDALANGSWQACFKVTLSPTLN